MKKNRELHTNVIGKIVGPKFTKDPFMMEHPDMWPFDKKENAISGAEYTAEIVAAWLDEEGNIKVTLLGNNGEMANGWLTHYVMKYV